MRPISPKPSGSSLKLFGSSPFLGVPRRVGMAPGLYLPAATEDSLRDFSRAARQSPRLGIEGRPLTVAHKKH
jgi:hypothetical protein